ncbi:hypothetical protein [Vibrio alginolyticus]|uniref:hypothetical protein n=1 Tax=Vibrio alginolyticus TaxID=663 RepID=UPI0006CA8B60|nr:hypothetical protein [Vibrio alginolyticus]KPM98683.1 hypothetical protein AOG25_09785 [Vibrio alginolyticus]
MKNYLKFSALSLMVLGLSACGSSSETTSAVDPEVTPKPDPTPVSSLNDFDLTGVQLVTGKHRTYAFDWQDPAKNVDQSIDYKVCKEKLSDPNFCIELGSVSDRLSLTVTTENVQYPRFDKFFIRATEKSNGFYIDSSRAKLIPHEYVADGQGAPISASSTNSSANLVMSANGDTIAVSDYRGGARDNGTVTVLEKQPDNTWVQSAMIGGASKKNYQQYGAVTKISDDGKTLLVSSRGDNFTYKYSCVTCLGNFNSSYASGDFEVLRKADDGSWQSNQVFDYTDLPAEYAGTIKLYQTSSDFKTVILKSSPTTSGPRTKEAIIVLRLNESSFKYELAIVIDSAKLGDQITNYTPIALNENGNTLLIKSAGNKNTLITLWEYTYDVRFTSSLLLPLASGATFTPDDVVFSPYEQNLLIWGSTADAPDGNNVVALAELPYTNAGFGEPTFSFVDMTSKLIEPDGNAFVRDYNDSKLLLASARNENNTDGEVYNHVVFDLNQPGNPEVGRIQTRVAPEYTSGTANGGVYKNFVKFSGDMSTTTTYVIPQSKATAY